ncbi:DUF4012 domain-containing protein [Microbacterium sp. CJ88]|uniref:DUF4012 domain-containing protein n=1 Tax=Microbacterium sp. CJ88 TaxID=3445672 RepID=UPI003F655A17
MTGRTRAVRPLRIRTVVLLTTVALALLVAAVAWVGVRGVLAARELQSAIPLADRLQTAVTTGDAATATAVASEIDAHAQRAADLTADPIWRASELIPGAGPNLAAVRVAATALHTLGGEVVTPLAAVVTGGTAGEGVDVAALTRAQAPLEAASTALGRVSADLAQLPTAALLPPLRDGVVKLGDTVTAADRLLAPLSRAATVLPGILGADGPKTILLMVQNNAELRTGGGISGTFAELHADHGVVTMTAQADSSQFPALSAPIAPVPDSLSVLYGDIAGRFVQDSTVSADFALTGRLAAAWWSSHTGTAPDAVLSIDPVVLQSLVAATGPIALADGTQITADDLVQKLLIDPYLTMTSDQQTAYFAEATGAVVSRVFGGGLDPLTWARALAQPIEQGHISIWSADPAAQAALEQTPLGGPAARQRQAGGDAYAVYLNDATGGKLDSFMTTSLSSGVASCRADGRREVVVSVTLTSTVPADAEQRFPGSMTGDGRYHVAIGDIGMVVSVSAPPGSYFGGVRKDGTPLAGVDGEDAGFPVSLARINLQPGETNTLEFRFVTDRTDAFTPVLLHTPLLTAPEVTAVDPVCG